jgi:hypothetical protein
MTINNKVILFNRKASYELETGTTWTCTTICSVHKMQFLFQLWADWQEGCSFLPKIRVEGHREDVYQGIPKWIWNSDFSWQEIVDSAEDAEWLIDLYRQNSRIGKYENRRYDYENGLTVDRHGYVIVYTDGSCPGNGQYGAKGGIGVWFGHDHDW